jgi:hypothetical protein
MKACKQPGKSGRLGLSAGLLMTLLGKRKRSASSAELYKQDFHPNAQRMGLHFSGRMRKVFRRRWLRLK